MNSPTVEKKPPRKRTGKHVLGKLSAVQVAKAKNPGYLSDGGNLYLRITKSGSKNWEFIYSLNGKTRQMGLGGVYKVSLERARQKAADARAKLGDGIDPVAERQVIVDKGQGGGGEKSYLQ
jgi:hypothetical protein